MKRKLLGAGLLGLGALAVTAAVYVASVLNPSPLTGSERTQAIADAQVVGEAVWGTPAEYAAMDSYEGVYDNSLRECLEAKGFTDFRPQARPGRPTSAIRQHGPLGGLAPLGQRDWGITDRLVADSQAELKDEAQLAALQKAHPEIFAEDYEPTPARTAAQKACLAVAPSPDDFAMPLNKQLTHGLSDSWAGRIAAWKVRRLQSASDACFTKKTGIAIGGIPDSLTMRLVDRFGHGIEDDVRTGGFGQIEAALAYENSLRLAADECRKPSYEYLLAVHADTLRRMVTHPAESGINANKAAWARLLSNQSELVSHDHE